MESRLEETPTTESRGVTTEKLINDLKTMLQRAENITRERAKAADKLVREKPYHTVGIAFGIGLLIGFLSRRR